MQQGGRMTSITITIPIPDKRLSPNARVHWAAKGRLTRLSRSGAELVAKSALKGAPPPKWAKCRANVTAYFRTKAHPDPDNLIARMKSVFDGFEDAGIVADDKGLWPERPIIGKDAKNPRIEITITEEVECSP
jgi:crossover junction endodeoxyribonuclease RusA